MRNAINGTWVFGIMITFMAIFIAYITIQINYSNAFKLKTDIVTILEQYDGFNPTSVDRIDQHIEAIGYKNKGYCNTTNISTGEAINTFGVNNRNPLLVNRNPGQYQYCVSRERFETGSSERENRYYYSVDVFFAFNLPVLGNIYNFRVNGTTNVVYYPSNGDYFNTV